MTEFQRQENLNWPTKLGRPLRIGALIAFAVFIPLLAAGIAITAPAAQSAALWDNLLTFCVAPAIMVFSMLAAHVSRLAVYVSGRRARRTALVGGALTGFVIGGLAATALSLLSDALWTWIPPLLAGTVAGGLCGGLIATIMIKLLPRGRYSTRP